MSNVSIIYAQLWQRMIDKRIVVFYLHPKLRQRGTVVEVQLDLPGSGMMEVD